VTVNGRVVTFNEVGLAAAVAGLGLVSMTVGAARKGISEGLLVRVLADSDMGEVELHAVFPARKRYVRGC
jgi:DNA-binding transcriptional LysR family regulator